MKKKLLILLSGITACTTLNAQTQQGSWMINPGVLSAERTKLSFDDSHTTSISLTPGAGYFVAKNFALGMSTTLSFSNGPSFQLSAVPFARYYVPVKDIETQKLRFFGQISAGGNFYFNKYNGSYQTDNIYSLGAQLGAAYFILPNASIEGALAANQYRYSSNHQNAVGFRFSFNYFLFKRTKQETPAETATQQPLPVPTRIGTILLGSGTASVANIHSSVNGSQGTQLSLYQKTGVFIGDDLVLGAALGYKWFSQTSSQEVTAVPFIRYYLPVKNDGKAHNLRFFAEVGGGLGLGRYSNGYPDHAHSNYHYWLANGTVGANYFLTPHVSLETGFRYERQGYSGFHRNVTGITAGFNVFLFKDK